MLRRIAAVCALAFCLVPVLVAGCAKKKILALENLPPETTLFVSGPVDTVNHVVRLFWFGSDPDGSVVGYELRFKNPALPADTAWVFTTRTDSTFTIFSPSGYAMPRFEVRAIDDMGQRDPSPAREDFQFSNQPPTVTFTRRLRMVDTTYASATLTWSANDPDGAAGAMRFLVGLDTLPAALHLVSGNSFTIDTTDFKEAGAYPNTRPRMAFIRALDDGGRASGWDSVRWVVRAPSSPGVHPRLLIVDDVPGTFAANVRVDSLWANNVARNLPAGSYSILRLDLTQPFRSAKDLLQTFKEFDSVIWYRDVVPTFSTLLSNYQDALATYLDGGGKLVIEGLDLIEGDNATGPLRRDWVTRYLGSTDMIRAVIAGRSDSTVSWTIAAGYIDTLDGSPVLRNIYLRSPAWQDSMWNRSNNAGLRGFAVRDTHFVALWAPDSALSPRVPRSIPVAVSVPVPESPPGPGRVIVFTTPIRGANGFFNAPRILAKMFQQMGLNGP